MKRMFCWIAAVVMMAFSFSAAFADSVRLTQEEAYLLMDTLESKAFSADWQRKDFEKENALHTREWEKQYGKHTRWQGDVLAAYVLAYGMMPTYDAASANPLAVLPGPDTLGEAVARAIAMDAIVKVESRLTYAELDSMESTWGFYFSRDLDWFWEPSGTWVFRWYSETGCQVCMAYVSDCRAQVTVVFDFLDRTPDDEGIRIFTDFSQEDKPHDV